MAVETTPFNIQDHLASHEEQVAYLEAAIEEDDPGFLAIALGDIAQARGIARFSRETGLSSEIICQRFRRNGEPTFDMTAAAMRALGLKLKLVAA